MPLFACAFLAAFAVSLPAQAEGVSLSEATAAQQRSAQKELARGQKLFKAGKFDEAIEAFQAAHDIVADPEARLMIARSRQNQGDLVAAHADYNAALREAQAAASVDRKYDETLKAAHRELKELEGVVARLTITLRHAPEGTAVSVEGEPIDAEKLGTPLLLPPGLVNVVAVTPDGREASRQLTLNAGEASKVELAFARDDTAASVPPEEVEEPESPSDSSGSNTAAWIAGGVGLAGLATFAVFGAMSNSKFSELEDACPNDRCAADREDEIDDGQRFQTIANVGLAVGIVGVGASAALFAFGSGAPEQSEESAKVRLGIGLGSLHLRGRFE